MSTMLILLLAILSLFVGLGLGLLAMVKSNARRQKELDDAQQSASAILAQARK